MYRKFLKRFIDFLVSFLILIALSPILLIISVLLLIFNKGAGVFFTQRRPGLHGKIFEVIKFKTMKDTKDTNGNLLPDKERATPIGKFIRTTSLDELPQMINVLKGDMSLIGPRPLLEEYLPLYSKEQARRHDIRPGITGLAQCSGRNNLSWHEKFELDVWYVDNVSLKTDIDIIFKTLKKVIFREDIVSTETKKIGKFNGHN